MFKIVNSKYFKHSFWMLFEQFMKIIAGIFVGVFIARYLGPDRFGVLSYAVAIVSVFIAASKLGMESILVRELARTENLKEKQSYVSTVFVMMLTASIIGFIIIGLIILFLNEDFNTKFIIFLVSIGILFQSFLVFDYNFQSLAQGKYSSIAKSIALIISSTFKIYLVLMHADLWSFAVAFAIEHLLIAIWLYLFFKKKSNIKFTLKHIDKNIFGTLLKSSIPLVFAGIIGLLAVRVDQYMIQNFLSSYELGLYSAATKIYEGWIILPAVVTIALFPMLVKLKKENTEAYKKRLVDILGIIIWIDLLICIVIYIYAYDITILLYGEAYTDSATVLVIIMFTSIFTAINAVSFRFFTIEHQEKSITIRVAILLTINIVLNYIFIPKYGIEGAAFATLISTAFTAMMIDFSQYSKNKVLIKIKFLSIFYPLSILLKRQNR